MYGTYHWGNSPGADLCGGCGTIFTNTFSLSDWHVYAVEWD